MLLFLWGAALPSVACAQEMLQNRSFENPVAPANGNNFYGSIPNWVVTSSNNGGMPINIIKAYPGYINNPTTTPIGGGSQYFDINSDAGVIRQSFTLSELGVIDYGIWFSVRDYAQALSGLIINIRNSNNVIVSTASTSFVANDPIGLWKRAGSTNVTVPSGTYTFEVIVPDHANVDLASLVFTPTTLRIIKSSSPYSDPYNQTTNPKLVPGGFVDYSINVVNPGPLSPSSGTVFVTDATPRNLALFVGDINGAGSGPSQFIQGTPTSNLSYSFIALGSTTDRIEFSNDGGASYNYIPTADVNGVDPTVTHVRIKLGGVMASNSSFTIKLRYRIK